MIQNFAGQSGTYWFFGIVEDNNDPLNSGRVRVRCFGIHDLDKTAIPTATLPWALVGVSTNSSSSDIGSIEIGTCVYGIFLDGNEKQKPFVQLVVPGLNIGTNTQLGFQNLKPNPPPKGSYTGNNYARVTNIPPRIYYAPQSTARGINISEPQNTRQPKYTFIKASMSDKGHLWERDDTEGAERLCFQHGDGSYVEMNQNHDMVLKSVKDLYQFCTNYYTAINKSRHVSIGGSDYLKVISGDKVIEIPGGKFILEAKGSDITINGDYKLSIKGNCNMTVNGNVTESVSGNYNLKVGGSYTVSSGGTASIVAGGTLLLNGSVVLIG